MRQIYPQFYMMEGGQSSDINNGVAYFENVERLELDVPGALTQHIHH